METEGGEMMPTQRPGRVWVQTPLLIALILGATFGSQWTCPAAAVPLRRGQPGSGGVSVRLAPLRRYNPRLQGKVVPNPFGGVGTMQAFYSSMDRRGILVLDPYGITPLRFRLTNHRSSPVTVRFVGIQERRRQHPQYHLNVDTVSPRSVRLPARGSRWLTVAVGCPDGSEGSATFRFPVIANGHSPEVTGCRLRYRSDPNSE
jgi:hypothetical protein